jgi:hypothetical protein
MGKQPFMSDSSLLRVIAISILSIALIIGCAKGNEEEKRSEQAEKLMEEYQEELDDRMLEEAEKRGIKEEVQNIIEARKEEEREKREKEEKEIRKILGEPGKPVEDNYLQELFTPEIPYGSLNIAEKANGSRYIIVDTGKKINSKQKSQYVFETLLGRGVSIHRVIDGDTGQIDDFMITIARKTENPGVIEYSENLIYTPDEYKLRLEKGLREALRFKDDKIIVEIAPEFGHKFKRKIIYPEKDAEGPEPQDIMSIPKNIKRYPNSKRIGFYKGKDGQVYIYYVTKDPIEKVISFFVEKKKEYYDDNPHMRKRPFYREGSEEHYFLTHLQPYRLFGIKDIGGGVLNFSISDSNNKKHVYIDIRQSENTYLKNYVEIIIRGKDY